MDAYEALVRAGEKAGVPMYKIGPSIGKTRSYVSNGMARGSSPTCAKMAEMAGVCGYGLALVPLADMPGTAFVIGDETENVEDV